MEFLKGIFINDKIAADKDAFMALPKFFRINGEVIGIIIVYEGVRSKLERMPQQKYFINGVTEIKKWRMRFMSADPDKPLGETDYFKAVSELEKYAVYANSEYLITDKISRIQMENIISRLD